MMLLSFSLLLPSLLLLLNSPIHSFRTPSLSPRQNNQYRSKITQTMKSSTSQTLENGLESSKSLSFLTFIGASAKNTVSSIAMVVVLLSSSWSPLFFIIMGVFNAILSKVLKNIIKQPRPLSSAKPGYGMPSSHAQSLFYFSTVLSLTFFRSALSSKSLAIVSVFSSMMIYIYAILASSWRVVKNLHSVQQTIVGCVIGLITGILAFYLETHSLLSESIYIKHNFILYKMNCLNFASNWIKDHLSTISVPILLRAFILLAGGLVLYSKEIKKVIKKDT